MTLARPFLIAGGGIGGLTAAIGLARRGVRSIVLEKRTDARQAGAGIQLGPNAVGSLRRLEVAEELATKAGRPAAIHVRDGGSSATLTRFPLGRWIEDRHGAPYWTVHRQDLHDALQTAARRYDAIGWRDGWEVTSFVDHGDGVLVRSAAGETIEGAGFVGADGIGSLVRKRLFGDVVLAHSGKTATRTILDVADVVHPLSLGEVGVWLTPWLHVVHYPVDAGRALAVVAIINEDWVVQGWDTPVATETLLAKLRPLAPGLRTALGKAQGWRAWALPAPVALDRWSRGRVTLLGDAAHPVLPFLAQGGALAIEDGEVLATCIAESQDDIAGSFQRYEAARSSRSRRVQQASSRNGRIYHLDGPARIARDGVLRAVPPARLMAGLDWLYGWRA